MPNERARTFRRDDDPANWRMGKVDGRADINIGGPGAEFIPMVSASKWHGECCLDVSAAQCVRGSQEEKIVTRGGNNCLEFEAIRTCRGRGRGGLHAGRQKGETHQFKPGSLEWDITWDSLASMPDDTDSEGNYIVEFDLSNPPGLSFYEQSFPTPQEIDEGCWCPDNVHNSFAVYFNKSGRFLRPDGSEIENYETGKFCHLYRPLCIAADGYEFWGWQSIEGTTLTVTIPKSEVLALSAAQWPLKLDPTFGYTSEGGSSTDIGGSATLYVYDSSALYTASAGDTVTGYSVLSDDVVGVVCDVSSYEFTTVPTNRLHVKETIPLTTTGTKIWYSIGSLSHGLTSGTSYIPALAASGGAFFIYYDTGTSGDTIQGSANFPAVYGGSDSPISGFQISVYATYTTGGGGTTFVPQITIY